MDAQEATDKLRTVQRVLAAFKAQFLETRARSDGVWKLHPAAPFKRLDAFAARCAEVYDLRIAVLHFGRLERIEIGGTKVYGISFQTSKPQIV